MKEDFCFTQGLQVRFFLFKGELTGSVKLTLNSQTLTGQNMDQEEV